METRDKAKQLLDAGMHRFPYRDLVGAMFDWRDEGMDLLINSTTFGDFLQKAQAKVSANGVPEFSYLPAGMQLTWDRCHIDVSQSLTLADTAHYRVYSGRRVFMNSVAYQMFSRIHADFLAELMASQHN